jgi:hypothetical protein
LDAALASIRLGKAERTFLFQQGGSRLGSPLRCPR